MDIQDRRRAGGNVFAVLDRVHAAFAAIVDRAQAALLRERQAEFPGLLQRGEVHHHIDQPFGVDRCGDHLVLVPGVAEIASVHHPAVLPDFVSQQRALVAVGPRRAIDRPGAEQAPLLDRRRQGLGAGQC